MGRDEGHPEESASRTRRGYLRRTSPSSAAGVCSDVTDWLPSPSQAPDVTTPVVKTPPSPLSTELVSQSSQACTSAASAAGVCSVCSGCPADRPPSPLQVPKAAEVDKETSSTPTGLARSRRRTSTLGVTTMPIEYCRGVRRTPYFNLYCWRCARSGWCEVRSTAPSP
jgi:hypothetical protein